MSEEIAVALIVALVVYPFAMLGLSIWIAGDGGLYHLRAGFAAGCVVGCILVALAFWADFRLSKYSHVDFLAATVFVLGTGATGAV
jgi:hypothetical protein